MDEYVKAILQSWDLEELIPFLKFQKIDEASFNDLTGEKIDQMFLLVNDEPKKEMFKKKCIERLLSMPVKNQMSAIDNVEENGLMNDATNTNENKENEMINGNDKQDENNLNESVNVSEIDDGSLDDMEVIACSETIAKLLLIGEKFSQIEKNMPMYQSLIQNPVGRLVLFYYAEHNNFNTFVRKQLCKLVIEHEMDVTITSSTPFSLNGDKLLQVAKNILYLFKSEKNCDLYYCKGYFIKEKGKEKPTRVHSVGLLRTAYTRYRNKLGRFEVLRDISTRSRSKKKEVNESAEFDVDLELLYTDSPPNENEAFASWISSFYQRHDHEYKTKTASEILEKFALLRSSIGPKIIESDFEAILSKNLKSKATDKFKDTGVAQRLVTHWGNFAKKLVVYARNNLNTPSEDEVNKVDNPSSAKKRKKSNGTTEISNLLLENSPVESVEHTNVLALLLLPKLINYSIQLKSNVEKFDQFTSYIVHLKDSTEEAISTFEKERQAFYADQDVTTLQPYVIICGSLNNIVSSYVIVEDTKYKCDSPLKSVDLCFKVFFALQLEYSVGCPHIWSFFHKNFYEIRGFKKIRAAVKNGNLHSDVNQITE